MEQASSFQALSTTTSEASKFPLAHLLRNIHVNIWTSEEKQKAPKAAPYWSISIVNDRLWKFVSVPCYYIGRRSSPWNWSHTCFFSANLIPLACVAWLYQLRSRRLDDAGAGCNDTISGSFLFLPLRVEKREIWGMKHGCLWGFIPPCLSCYDVNVLENLYGSTFRSVFENVRFWSFWGGHEAKT